MSHLESVAPVYEWPAPAYVHTSPGQVSVTSSVRILVHIYFAQKLYPLATLNL